MALTGESASLIMHMLTYGLQISEPAAEEDTPSSQKPQILISTIKKGLEISRVMHK